MAFFCCHLVGLLDRERRRIRVDLAQRQLILGQSARFVTYSQVDLAQILDDLGVRDADHVCFSSLQLLLFQIDAAFKRQVLLRFRVFEQLRVRLD